MNKIFRWLGVSLATIALTAGIVSTLAVPVVAETGGEITRGVESTNQEPSGDTNLAIPEPTFDLQSGGLADDQTINLRMGNNRLLLANDLNASETIPGLLFSAGNTLGIASVSEYGFLAGNLVEVSGTIEKDLFVAGNMITLTKTAEIGGDVFGAGNEFIINNDLQGDLAVTAATVRFKGNKIAGNVNIDAEKIVFENDVQIAGALTYNDTASVVGLEKATYHSREVYHIVETEITALDLLLEKLLSVAGLFIAMAVIIFLAPRLHTHIANASDAKGAVTNFAIGAWVLLLAPIMAILLICTVIGAPLGLILLGLYIIAVYLSQGFAGLWLGHLLIEKLCKGKGNAYLEALVGVAILGALALVPYVGTLTGLLALLLGLGLIVSQIRGKRDQATAEHRDTEAGQSADSKAKKANAKKITNK